MFSKTIFSDIKLHIVSYNSDLYESFGEAATQTDGLAVLGILFEVSYFV